MVEVDVALRPAEEAMLRDHYLKGLGEFGFRNGLDLSRVDIRSATSDAPAVGHPASQAPLIPFGGGIDSIVTVESLKRRHPDGSLFVVEPDTAPFAAIEGVLPLAGLPVARATRHLDAQLFEDPASSGFRQGHVPVTGIITALAVLVAAGRGFGAVVMSNEWSASAGNLVVRGRVVNHQFSKSREFETEFANVVRRGDRRTAGVLVPPAVHRAVGRRTVRRG